MKVQPYLQFQGRCAEAIELYKSALGAEVEVIMRWKDCPEPQPGMIPRGAENKVMHSSLRIGETTVLASDALSPGQASFQGISLALYVPSDAEAKRRFELLAEGGQVRQPLMKTFFTSSFGLVADRFGVSWMIVVDNASGQRPALKESRIMFMKILLALGVIVLVLVVVVALQPSDLRVSRTATIAAPAPAVFAQVNDFHRWPAWSPYEKLDPAMRRSYAGAPAGSGAVYAWSGNSKAGEGRSTITESRPNELIRIKLEFIRPFAATSTAEFSFAPAGDQTAVTWTLVGTNNFMAKAVHLVLNMDRMIGGQFEEGLGALKSVVEGSPS